MHGATTARESRKGKTMERPNKDLAGEEAIERTNEEAEADERERLERQLAKYIVLGQE